MGKKRSSTRTHGPGRVAAAVERGVSALPGAAGVHAGNAGGGGGSHRHRQQHEEQRRHPSSSLARACHRARAHTGSKQHGARSVVVVDW
jgi:hypothetical protein